MAVAVNKFSALELCYKGEYLTASEVAGLRPGERPEKGSGRNSGYARRLLVAGIITSTLGGIQQTGDQAQAREFLLECIGLSPELAGEARSWIARSYLWAGDYAEALAVCDLVLAESLASHLRFRTLLLKVICCLHFKQFEVAAAVLAEMEKTYDEQDLLLKAKFHLERGRLWALQEETDRAVVEYDCAINFFHESGDIRCEAVAATHLSDVYLQSELFDEAHKYAKRARDLFQDLGDKSYEARTLDLIAQIYVKQGQLFEAKSVLNKALALIQHNDLAFHECLKTRDKIKHLMGDSESTERDRLNEAQPLPKPRDIQNLERREPTMTPLDCASRIIENPDNAIPLFDLLAWASNGPHDLQHQAELDHIQATIYAKTPDGEKQREAYKQSRLMPLIISDS